MPERTSEAARWFEATTGREVLRSRPLLGGLSSEVERQWLDDGSSIVVRTISDTGWLEIEPDLIEREARALEILEDSHVETPVLVVADPSSARLAMSFLEGAMVVDREGLAERADVMAVTAAHIAAVPLPRDHGLPVWRSWAPQNPQPPTWGDAELWQRCIDVYRATQPPIANEQRLLHRDLHPLNMLWSDRSRPAVVDWVNACVGHPHAELGHLRWNLTVLAGLDVADEMLRHYTDAMPDIGPYDPWWDLSPVMSFLPGPIGGDGWHAVGRSDLTPEVVVARTHEFLRSALDRT